MERRNNQLKRSLRLLALLRHGKTLRALALATGVTERTIRRDLLALRQAGLNIPRDDEFENAVYRLTGPCAVCRSTEV